MRNPIVRVLLGALAPKEAKSIKAFGTKSRRIGKRCRTRLLLIVCKNVLQIQCYQCEEMSTNDCSTPEFIVNCTVNVQDMCQKEVLVKPDGIHYRKSCASSGACLIASSGYQQFCTGRLNSVCITCCNTPLCNGPKRKRPVLNTASRPGGRLRQLLMLLGTATLATLLLST
uniref:LY6/PLAUR domain containing 1 n=1 Tax=Neogobius melanostomus TaxID=47308 RepID=A0A8C6SRP1_9GOBI